MRSCCVYILRNWLLASVASVLGFLSSPSSYGQSKPHQILSVQSGDPGQIVIGLEGDPDPDFQPFFDIFWLESSYDLIHWQVTHSVLHTNGSTAATQFTSPSNNTACFFRAVTNICPTALPKPTGPYLVGTVSKLFSSATRNSTASGTNREFMVSIFYPASPASWRPPEPYFEPIWDTGTPRGVTVLFGKQFLTTPRATEVPTNLVSHALPGLPLLEGKDRFPILVYGHGGQYFRRDNIHKMTELASYGYVVVSADYYDAWFSYLPNGTLAVYDPQSDYDHTKLSTGLHDLSVLDTRFLLDELERLDQSDSRFGGRLDLKKIGVLGWSFGGAVMADVSRTDTRVKAAVLYDAAFWSATGVTLNGLSKPFLCIHSMRPPTPDWPLPAIDLVNRASKDAYFFQITDSDHGNFSDVRLIDKPTPFNYQTTALILRYTRAFFDHYLLGQTTPLLDGPPAGTQLYNWKQK